MTGNGSTPSGCCSVCFHLSTTGSSTYSSDLICCFKLRLYSAAVHTTITNNLVQVWFNSIARQAVRWHWEENWIACQGGLLKSKFQTRQTHSDYGKFLPKDSSEVKMHNLNHLEKFSSIFSWFQPRWLSGSEAGRVPLVGATKAGVVPCRQWQRSSDVGPLTLQMWSPRDHLDMDQEWRKAPAWPWDFEMSFRCTTQPKRNLSLSSLHFPGWSFSWLLLPKEKVSG